MSAKYSNQKSAGTAKPWFTFTLLVVILMLPTAVHRNPFVFWDTAQYYEYGKKLVLFSAQALHFGRIINRGDEQSRAKDNSPSLKKEQPPNNAQSTGLIFYGARSPFYSSFLYALSQLGSIWLIRLTAALATAWLILRIADHISRPKAMQVAVALTILATFGSTAWYFIGLMMPDAYAAIALLGAASLFAFCSQMGWPELLVTTGLVYSAMLFHGTHLFIVAGSAIAGLITTYLLFQVPLHRQIATILVGGAIVGALITQSAFDFAARKALGASPQRPPFLMARVSADGPGRRYLREKCTQPYTFTLCQYRDRNFTSADEFLWSGDPTKGVLQTLPFDQRLQLIKQEPSFLASVAFNYPWDLLKSVTRNIADQVVLIMPREAWIDPGEQFSTSPFREAQLFEVAPFLNGCIANRGSCIPVIPEGLVTFFTGLTAAISLLMIAWHLAQITSVRTTAPEERNAIIFAAVIVTGLLVNAAVCGALSGPHPRYEARIVWLLIIAAAVLEFSHPRILKKFIGDIRETKATA